MLKGRPKPGEVTVQYISADGSVRTEIQKSEYRVLRKPLRERKARTKKPAKSGRSKKH
jgi:hypothetical protein